MSNKTLRYGSGKSPFVGQSIIYPVPIPLDATQYEGAVIVAEDGQLYYSNGFDWVIPTEDVEISRPSARVPTNSLEQTQLRLSAFRSPAGLSQVGILFEISTNGVDFVDAETRLVNDEFASLYQLLYPEDGFEPGDEIFWRGKYLGTDGGQSEFSIPFRQTFPQLIDDPTAVTRQGAVTGTVELSPFFSALGLDYVETQIRFWEDTANPATDAPVATVTSVNGAVVNLPAELVEGQAYQWSGRYGGRQGGAGPILYTEFTAPRFILKGVASMILVYDPALALNRTINLPMGVYGGIVNVTVDWGDGTSNAYTTGGIRSKTYAAGVTGLVTVIISGQLEQFGGNTNIQGLVRVDNIGVGLGLNSLREMFRNVTSNTTFCTPNIPPTVKSIRGMFLNGNVNFNVTGFTVDQVEDFSECFKDNTTFNQNIGGWDMFSAQTLESMFEVGVGSNSFNQNIGGWNVSTVKSFKNMFALRNVAQIQVFNQNIGGWDMSSAEDISGMFGLVSTAGTPTGSHAFNNGESQSINNWNVSNVTNMRGVFGNNSNVGGSIAAHAFNQPINQWDVSKVTNFSQMFSVARSFNQSLAGWNLSSATSVSRMFAGSDFSNDVSGWVLPTSLQELFTASIFNHPSISSWDTSSVLDMSSLFRGAASFDQPVGAWDVSGVTNMSRMFEHDPNSRTNTYAFNQPINDWDVSSVTDMSRMFATSYAAASNVTHSFNRPLNQWNVENVSTMEAMFARFTGGAQSNNFNQDISMWKLRSSGVNLNDFLRRSAGILSFSTENYSKLLAGWANSITDRNGPFNVVAGFGDRNYHNTTYFPGEPYETAVTGRAYLTNSNRVEVSGASTANADGTYLFNTGTQAYVKSANGWYFLKVSNAWVLFNNLDQAQATQQDSANLAGPHLVQTWDGVLASATVRRTGAAWTITDGGLV